MNEISELDLQNLRHLIGGFTTTHCKMPVSYTHLDVYKRQMLVNMAAIAVLMLLGCHNPFMFNQSTLVLGYLLLYGYDVSGRSYVMRLAGLAVGALITCVVFYRNHAGRVYRNGCLLYTSRCV